MGRFRLSAEAEADLVRIHQWGTVTYGEDRADRHFAAFFDHFVALAEHPLAHPAVEDIRGVQAQCMREGQFGFFYGRIHLCLECWLGIATD